METILLIILTFILMTIGLLGVVLPFLPSVPVAWLGLFIYAWGTGFQKISLTEVLVFLAVTVVAMLFDFAAPLLGAKKYQASKYGIGGAALGLTIGVIEFGPLGIIVGPLVGAFLGELIANKESERAFKSALGAFVGFIVGSLIKIIIILIMIGFFIASLF